MLLKSLHKYIIRLFVTETCPGCNSERLFNAILGFYSISPLSEWEQDYGCGVSCEGEKRKYV